MKLISTLKLSVDFGAAHFCLPGCERVYFLRRLRRRRTNQTCVIVSFTALCLSCAIAFGGQGLLQFPQQELHVVLCGHWSHDADAEDLSGERFDREMEDTPGGQLSPFCVQL